MGSETPIVGLGWLQLAGRFAAECAMHPRDAFDQRQQRLAHAQLDRCAALGEYARKAQELEMVTETLLADHQPTPPL